MSTHLILFLIFLGSVLKLISQNEFENYMTAQVEANRFKGTVLIAKANEVIFSEGFGLASAEFNIGNSTESKFLIGSITKPFTAYAITNLFARHQIPLETKISAFGYDFPKADTISIAHLLHHRSGLKDYYDLPHWKERNKLGIQDYDLVRETARLPFYFSPGSGFRYSNTGYIILGEILEKQTGKTFEEIIRTEICLPFDLMRTGVMNNQKVVVGLSSGYRSSPRGLFLADYVDYSVPFASGNMYASVGDLYVFWQAIASYDSETGHYFPRPGEQYRFGWATREYFGKKGYGHTGRMNGYVGTVLVIPSEEIFIAVLSNDDHTPIQQISRDLLAISIDQPIKMPQKKTLIPLTKQDFNPYAGDYVISPGDTIHVFSSEGAFFIQETSQPAHEMYPFEGHQFFFNLLEFTLIFDQLDAGKMQRLILKSDQFEIVGIRQDQ